MNPDYVLLLVIAVTALGGGLLVLRASRKYNAQQDKRRIWKKLQAKKKEFSK